MQDLKVDGYTQMDMDFECSLISCRQIIERTSLWTTKTAAMQTLSLESLSVWALPFVPAFKK
jgi:hypothetical protein